VKNKKFLISLDVEHIPDELDLTIEEAMEHMLDEIWGDIGSYHNLRVIDITKQDIKIGSVLTLQDSRQVKIIDNSDISEEYPVALLDINNNKILITTYSMEYMQKYRYVYIIDREIGIAKVENFQV